MSQKVQNFYKYKIDSFDIFFPNETPKKVDPKQISGLIIERDYDNDYFPVIKIGLSVEPTLYSKIRETKLDVRFRIRLQKYIYDENKKFKFKYDVFNTLFAPFMNDNTPFIEEKSVKKEKDTLRTDKTPKDLYAEYTFYLFRESELFAAKKYLNTVLSNATMTDAITYCLSMCRFDNVLMSPIENKESYTEILLPPMTS
jgi:hypothetical protein